MPEFWATPGHAHPGGVFASGLHKNYILLRTNAAGSNPYSAIYHEYFHALTAPSELWLPLWLSEGLAVFYGSTRIAGQQVELGRTEPALLAELRGSKLIPLEELFRADKCSPEYNERERTTLFYAESWALTHYLVLGDGQAHRRELEDYLSRVGSGAWPDEAARLAFGDLQELGDRLRDYIHRGFFASASIKTAPTNSESPHEAHSLSAAETLALIGDSFVCRDRLQDARPRLSEALRLDPKNAMAYEAMGLLHYRLHERDAAVQSLGQAIELNPDNFLSRYYRALLLQEPQTTPAGNTAIESDLSRSIALNPDFAPSYDALAGFYSRQGQKPSEALALAQKAIALDPGNVSYQIDAGLVLMQIGRYDDARAAGLQARAAARDADDRARVDAFLLTVEQAEEASASVSKLKEAQKSATSAAPQSGDSSPPMPAPASTPSPSPVPSPGSPPGDAAKSSTPKLGPRASAEGKIISVSCSGAELRLKLKMQGYSLDLHSSNYARVLFLYQNWSPPDNFNPCRHLNGVHAEVKYAVVHRQDYGGEILSLEILY